MTRMADNQLAVGDETWRRLNARKKPGDTFEDVIRRLLEEGTDESVPESVVES